MKKRILALLLAVIMTASLLSMTAWAEAEVAGDVNGVGGVTIEDAVLLCQYLAGWDVKVDAAADCTGDGIIDVKDAVLLSQFLAGMKVTFGSDDPYRYISDVEVPIDDIFAGDD